MTYPELEIIETVRAKLPTSYPYIPGLLTFREGPVLEKAFIQLENVPDVFVFDGMGQIHPRKIGIAAHMGLWLDKPTIGCGKTHFIGDYDTPAIEKGSYSELMYKGDQLGVVLRTRTKVKPVYISVGHRADIDTAVKLTLACTPKYRLPRPIRQAHIAAGEY
jgi:deoxyribonuclease V